MYPVNFDRSLIPYSENTEKRKLKKNVLTQGGDVGLIEENLFAASVSMEYQNYSLVQTDTVDQ